MKSNSLIAVGALGQAIWLDYIRRDLMTSGELKRLISEDGLRGITSNPAIFAKAMTSSHDYDEQVEAMVLTGNDAQAIYEALSQRDVRDAADAFRPLYDATDGADGFVSLEVNPHLAHDTSETIHEAHRLWAALARPNVLIKIPATMEGLPAITQLLSEGININVTLLFGLPRYRQVVDAYMNGLEARVAQGKPVNRVASVASFFVSRLDVLVDTLLLPKLARGDRVAKLARKAQGQVAVASAKMAYHLYQELFASDRFRSLAEKGARTQRLLWASTGTKNPDYSDIAYVEALIGPDTVNTLPVETLQAYRDHGRPVARLQQEVGAAARVLRHLQELGINLDQVTQQLEDEGVDKFNQPFDQLIDILKATGVRIRYETQG